MKCRKCGKLLEPTKTKKAVFYLFEDLTLLCGYEVVECPDCYKKNQTEYLKEHKIALKIRKSERVPF